MEKIDTTNINITALLEIVDYLENSERQSYEEYIFHEFESLLGESYENQEVALTKEFYDKPNIAHIYATVRRLKDSISYL